KCFGNTVIGSACQWIRCLQQSIEDHGQIAAFGVEDGGVVKTGSGAWCGRRAFAVPGVEADVVVITASGDERSLIAVFHGAFEAEQSAIEIDRALQIGDFQMHVPDARAGGNGVAVAAHASASCFTFCKAFGNIPSKDPTWSSTTSTSTFSSQPSPLGAIT